jgi:hypothetical protein
MRQKQLCITGVIAGEPSLASGTGVPILHVRQRLGAGTTSFLKLEIRLRYLPLLELYMLTA